MSQTSPFRGMDPFLEAHWHDVHSRLMNRISDQIAMQLPDDLIVSIEQSIKLGESQNPKRADLDVSDVSGWGDTSGWEADWNPAYDSHDSEDAGSVAITEPIPMLDFDLPHRFLEIRTVNGNHVVTVIELLSPANKVAGKSGEVYLEKRQAYLEAAVNFVEIDLLRQGHGPLFPVYENPGGIPAYAVFIKRFKKTPAFIGIEYGDRLPRFRIPLRPKDLPAIVDLQAALDEAYQAGQYWKRIDYANDALLPKPDAELEKLVAAKISQLTGE